MSQDQDQQDQDDQDRLNLEDASNISLLLGVLAGGISAVCLWTYLSKANFDNVAVDGSAGAAILILLVAGSVIAFVVVKAVSWFLIACYIAFQGYTRHNLDEEYFATEIELARNTQRDEETAAEGEYEYEHDYGDDDGEVAKRR